MANKTGRTTQVKSLHAKPAWGGQNSKARFKKQSKDAARPPGDPPAIGKGKVHKDARSFARLVDMEVSGKKDLGFFEGVSQKRGGLLKKNIILER